MSKARRFKPRYELASAGEPSAGVFPEMGGLRLKINFKERQATATTSAAMHWAMQKRLSPPEWVEHGKPVEHHERMRYMPDDLMDELLGSGPQAEWSYRKVVARVKLAGEDEPRTWEVFFTHVVDEGTSEEGAGGYSHVREQAA